MMLSASIIKTSNRITIQIETSAVCVVLLFVRVTRCKNIFSDLNAPTHYARSLHVASFIVIYGV
jgi:hypothetical protein